MPGPQAEARVRMSKRRRSIVGPMNEVLNQSKVLFTAVFSFLLNGRTGYHMDDDIHIGYSFHDLNLYEGTCRNRSMRPGPSH